MRLGHHAVRKFLHGMTNMAKEAKRIQYHHPVSLIEMVRTYRRTPDLAEGIKGTEWLVAEYEKKVRGSFDR